MTVSLKKFRERKRKKKSKRFSCSGFRVTAFKQRAFVSLLLKSCQLDNFGQAFLAQLLVCCTERAVKFFDHCDSCCDGNCCIFALRRNWVVPVSCKGNSKIVSCFCCRFYHMLTGSLVFTRIPRVQALASPLLTALTPSRPNECSGHLKILLCLTPDDFTRQWGAPWTGKG